MQSDRHAKVSERAHQIWVEEGRPHGKHDEHWHRAEREITEQEKAETAPVAARARRKSDKPAAASKAAPKTGSKSKSKAKAADQPKAQSGKTRSGNSPRIP